VGLLALLLVRLPHLAPHLLELPGDPLRRRLQPRGGGVGPQVVDHHVQIPKRPEPSPELATGLLQIRQVVGLQQRLEQVEPRLQPPGADAGLMNAGLVERVQRRRRMCLEGLDLLVEVRECSLLGLRAHRDSGIMAKREGAKMRTGRE
jgi:hypothetical protein